MNGTFSLPYVWGQLLGQKAFLKVRDMRIKVVPVGVLMLTLFSSSPLFAIGGNGNGNGNGIDSTFRIVLGLYPGADRQVAVAVYHWLREQRQENLAFLSNAEDPCVRMECNGLGSNLVTGLIAAAIEAEREEKSQLIGWVSAAAACFSALISLAALLLSLRQGWRLRDLERDQRVERRE